MIRVLGVVSLILAVLSWIFQVTHGVIAWQLWLLLGLALWCLSSVYDRSLP